MAINDIFKDFGLKHKGIDKKGKNKFWNEFFDGYDFEYYNKMKHDEGKIILMIKSKFSWITLSNYEDYVQKYKTDREYILMCYYISLINKNAKIDKMHDHYISKIITDAPVSFSKTIEILQSEANKFNEYHDYVSGLCPKIPKTSFIINYESFINSVLIDLQKEEIAKIMQSYPTKYDESTIKKSFNSLEPLMKLFESMSIFHEIEDFLNKNKISNEGKNIVYSELKKNVIANFSDPLFGNKFTIFYYKEFLIKNGYNIKSSEDDLTNYSKILACYSQNLDLSDEFTKELFDDLNILSYTTNEDTIDGEILVEDTYNVFIEYKNKVIKSFSKDLSLEDIEKQLELKPLEKAYDLSLYFINMSEFITKFNSYSLDIIFYFKNYIIQEIVKDLSNAISPTVRSSIISGLHTSSEKLIKQLIYENGVDSEKIINHDNFINYINKQKSKVYTVIGITTNFCNRLNELEISQRKKELIYIKMNNFISLSFSEEEEDGTCLNLINNLNNLYEYILPLQVNYERFI